MKKIMMVLGVFGLLLTMSGCENMVYIPQHDGKGGERWTVVSYERYDVPKSDVVTEATVSSGEALPFFVPSVPEDSCSKFQLPDAPEFPPLPDISNSGFSDQTIDNILMNHISQLRSYVRDYMGNVEQDYINACRPQS